MLFFSFQEKWIFSLFSANYLVKLSVLSKCFNELVLSYTLSGGATLRFTRESKRLLTDEEKMSGKDPFHCWGEFFSFFVLHPSNYVYFCDWFYEVFLIVTRSFNNLLLFCRAILAMKIRDFQAHLMPFLKVTETIHFFPSYRSFIASCSVFLHHFGWSSLLSLPSVAIFSMCSDMFRYEKEIN